jgi:DNA-binding beta-propeller fold protein YncE
VRVIKDPYPAFSAVAVDTKRNEVVLADESLFQIFVYDRFANTPTSITKPKRVIGGGLKADIEYPAGVYVDRENGDIYLTVNETHDALMIWAREARGDMAPSREVYTPRGTFGIAVDEEAQELYLTGQHESWVTVWKKTAKTDADSPVRLLQGDRTRLADPHGIALDTKNRVMFVSNYGGTHVTVGGGKPAPSRGAGRATVRKRANWPAGQTVPGSGEHAPPSITVYSMDAQGNTAPLRIIEGPNARLNWPTLLAFDPRRGGELFVANNTGNEILVFSGSANGDVAPLRILKGPKTLIKNPTGVAVDIENDELWVANLGGYTATVYRTTASGDTPPLRVIRSAPPGQPRVLLGNPGAVAYDSKRDQLLVPN